MWICWESPLILSFYFSLDFANDFSHLSSPVQILLQLSRFRKRLGSKCQFKRPQIHSYPAISLFRCKSDIGYKAKKASQDVDLWNPGCDFRGTIMHEVLHLLGFYHEHQRYDRDNSISIHEENIQPGIEISVRELCWERAVLYAW